MLTLEQPTKAQLDFIYEELNTTPEAIQRDVVSLVEWLEKQPHLPNIKDETFLAHCLLWSKNSMEKTKNSLDAYYTYKAIMPEVYDNRDPELPNIQLSMEAMSFIPLPKLTSDGNRISILRVFDPSLHNRVTPDDVIKSTYMSHDLRLAQDACRSNVLIFDLQNLTMPIISLILPNLRKFIILGTKGIPARDEMVYIINAPPSADSLITFAKSFVRKDLLSKIEILKGDKLTDTIPKELLPEDYGGELQPLSEIRDAWVETLKHHRDWFLEDNKLKADNSKRLTNKLSGLGDIPLEGSFRKITLD